PNPRDVRRLQSLESDLKAQRDATEKLAAEHKEMEDRVRELEAQLKAANEEHEQLVRANEASLRLIEKALKSRKIDAPSERTLPAFVEAVTVHIDALNTRAETAEKQVKGLEAQLTVGAEALKEAAQRFRDLNEQADLRDKEQRAQLAEAQKAIRELTKSSGALEPLLAENQRLAAQIDATATEMAALKKAAGDAKADISAAKAETEARVREELGADIAGLTKQQAALQKQLDTANVQLKEQGKPPLLSAEKVAGLLNELVGQMQGGISGLHIRDGELKLKVGFGAAGELGGFVIPTTDSTPEVRENLQEITFRFDRATSTDAQRFEP
ncbi:MAG TPA: hypothetical protein VER79_14535, partial [Candidatus Limnocylindrales bacterium]|nr:hypothetical protein [Candidatus Limnocylindrales bacterium]